MAIATTPPAAAPIPIPTRATISSSIDGARAAAMLATT